MKFELEMNLDDINEKERLMTVIKHLRDVIKRLDNQRKAGGAGEGVLFNDNQSAIGSFGFI